MIATNLKYLRKQKKLSQDNLAEALEVTRSRVGAWEEGRGEPSIDMLKTLADFFEINLDTLINTDLSILEDNKMMKMDDGRILFPVTIDHEDNDMIELVPERAAAGYLSGYNDPEYISDLDNFHLPFLGSGKFRAFPIKGDSMPPLNENSIVVGKYVDGANNIQDGKCYVILTKDDGIVFKRLKRNDSQSSYQFISDNTKYDPYDVSGQDMLEVWEYSAHIQKGEFAPTQTEQKETGLEGRLAKLEETINKLKDEK